MEVTFTKTATGLIPLDQTTREFFEKLKPGQVVHADFKKMRNYQFHKKLFSLLNLAFEYWAPGEIDSKHGAPEKNFNQFREDLTILAGYYYVVIRADGSTRVRAKSISFGSMEEEDFSKLYQSILTVIIERIMPKYSPDVIEQMADEFWSYA